MREIVRLAAIAVDAVVVVAVAVAVAVADIMKVAGKAVESFERKTFLRSQPSERRRIFVQPACVSV